MQDINILRLLKGEIKVTSAKLDYYPLNALLCDVTYGNIDNPDSIRNCASNNKNHLFTS